MTARNRAAGGATGGATKAATALLQERIHYIEELEHARAQERDARAAIQRATAAAQDAAANTSKAYRAALDAGWTTAELRQLGYGDKRTSRTRRTAQRTTVQTASDQANETTDPRD